MTRIFDFIVEVQINRTNNNQEEKHKIHILQASLAKYLTSSVYAQYLVSNKLSRTMRPISEQKYEWILNTRSIELMSGQRAGEFIKAR